MVVMHIGTCSLGVYRFCRENGQILLKNLRVALKETTHGEILTVILTLSI